MRDELARVSEDAVCRALKHTNILSESHGGAAEVRNENSQSTGRDLNPVRPKITFMDLMFIGPCIILIAE